MELSDKVKALIAKARIVNVQQWTGLIDDSHIVLAQLADDSGRFLTNDDLSCLEQGHYPHLRFVRQLREQASDIVDEARQEVLLAFPDITEPGGGLYPAIRANACWRDFWHFLRCITYGIAYARVDYTSDVGLEYMRQLYQELQVPLEAMVIGLEGVKAASLRRLQSEDSSVLAPYFDHLIEQLRCFRY